MPLTKANKLATPDVKEIDFNQSSTVGLATKLNVHGLDAVCNSMVNQDSMIHDETYRREIPNPPLLAQRATTKNHKIQQAPSTEQIVL